jgi:hypothetical protein
METYPEAIQFSNSDIKPVNREVKSTKRRFYSNNGSSFSQAGSEIRIPISGNFLLSNKDASLVMTSTYTVVAAGATSCSIDFSLFSQFQQIRIESAGTILEQIDEPGVLYNTMSQWNWQVGDITKNNGRQSSMQDTPIVATGVLTKTGEALATGTANYSSLPLSELMGIFSGDKCVPLMGTAGLTLVLTLGTLGARAVYSAATADTMTVSDIYVTATCIEAGPEYERALSAVKSGNQYNEVSILMKTAKRYVGAIATGAQTNAQIQVNDRSKSALGIWAIGRKTGDINLATAYSSSSSTFPTFVNHCMVINGMNFPSAQINTLGELAEESVKVANDYRKQCPDNWQQGGLVNRVTLTDGGSGGEGTATGATCCLAVNLSKQNYDDTMFGAGYDLSTSNSPNVFQVSYTPAAASTLNVYVLAQALLHINGMGQFSTEI